MASRGRYQIPCPLRKSDWMKGGAVKDVTRERSSLTQRTTVVWMDKLIHILWGKDQPLNRAEFTCYNGAGEKVVDFVR